MNTSTDTTTDRPAASTLLDPMFDALHGTRRYTTMTVDGGYGATYTCATLDDACALAEADGYDVLDVTVHDTLVCLVIAD